MVLRLIVMLPIVFAMVSRLIVVMALIIVIKRVVIMGMV